VISRHRRRGDPFDQRGISKLGAGDVDRHREFLAAALGVRPSRELPTCLVQHEVVDRCGESEPIGDRDERGGEHQSVLGVAPANERLDPAQRTVIQAEQRLVEHEQLGLLDRTAQLAGKAVLPVG
jgi:hypothetical protein